MSDPIDINDLSDDDVAKLGHAPMQSKEGAIDISKMSDDELAQLTRGANQQTPGLAESFARGAVEGATFGFDDKLGFSKEAREASRKANPLTHFAGEMVGSIAPMVGTGGLGAVAKGTGLLAKTARGVSAAMAPGEINSIGQAVGQGLKLGSVYGGLSGAGHADVVDSDSTAEALKKRASNAGVGAAIGAVTGPLLGAVGYPISKVAQSVAGARAAAASETKDAGAGALTALTRALQRDKIDPQHLIDQISAEMPTGKALSLPQVEQMLKMLDQGATRKEIAQTLSVQPATVSRYINKFNEAFSTPLNLVDRAKLSGKPGAGENTEWTLRAASATPGEGRAIARERLVERQIGQNQRIADAIVKDIGTADFEGTATKLTNDIKIQNDALYGAARAHDAAQIAAGTPLDLQPVLDAYAVKWVNSRGPIADAIKSAIDAFKPLNIGPKGNQGLKPIQSLDEFLQAKDELAALIDSNIGNRRITSELMKFKNDLYKTVERHNPEWKIANDAAADGFAAQRALELGSEFAGRMNTKMREHLETFKSMSDPEKALYKIGLARALNDRLMNKQLTHDLTQELRLPAARQALREILGKKDADNFFKIIDREATTTQTYRSQFGSQTQPLKEAQSDLNWAPQFESAWQMMNPSKIAEQVAIRLARTMQEKRNQQLLDIMTTDDPVRQLDILRRAQSVYAARNQAASNVGTPAIVSGAPLASGIVPFREDRSAQPVAFPPRRIKPTE